MCRHLNNLFFFLFVAPAPMLAQAPQQPVPTISVDVRNVILDVTVYDGNGYTSRGVPVLGLRKEDFEVLEDGKPQKISFFEEHKDVSLVRSAVPAVSPGILSNAPGAEAQEGSVTVILIDQGSTAFEDQPWMYAQLKKYLSDAPAGRPTAIFALTPALRIVHGFTGDPAVLLAALENNAKGTRPSPSPFMESETDTDLEKRPAQMLREEAKDHGSATATAMADQLDRFQRNMLQTEAVQRTFTTFNAFQQIARYLSGFPGRKNLIWLASSFTERPFGSESDFDDEVKKTTGLLAAARIAVYPIDVAGLQGPALGFEAPPSVGAPGGRGFDSFEYKAQIEASMNRNISTFTMDDIAERTGGEAYYHTNGVAWAINRIASQSNEYYTFAYTPTDDAPDGAYRKIQVRYKGHSRLAYRVAYRRGYYADAPHRSEDSEVSEDPLRPLMGPSQPNFSQLVFLMQVRRSDPSGAPSGGLDKPGAALAGQNQDLKGALARFTASMAISTKNIAFRKADGVVRCDFLLELVAYDEQGSPVNWISERLQPALEPEEYAAFLRNGLQVSRQIDLPRGTYYLRAGIYDLSTNKVGTLEFPIVNQESPPRSP